MCLHSLFSWVCLGCLHNLFAPCVCIASFRSLICICFSPCCFQTSCSELAGAVFYHLLTFLSLAFLFLSHLALSVLSFPPAVSLSCLSFTLLLSLSPRETKTRNGTRRSHCLCKTGSENRERHGQREGEIERSKQRIRLRSTEREITVFAFLSLYIGLFFLFVSKPDQSLSLLFIRRTQKKTRALAL